MGKERLLIYILLTLLAIALIYSANYLLVKNKENGYKSVKIWGYQLQNADPYNISKIGFDLVVIDYSRDGTADGMYNSSELEIIKASGTIPIAYISIGEAENYRFYWKDSWNSNPPEWLGKENPYWEGNYAVKYWYREWKNIIFRYIDLILNQGFSGLYLDKVDEFEYWSDPNNTEGLVLSEREAALKMIDFILEISNYCKNKVHGEFYIIPQNGERLLEYDNGSLLEAISGWGVEDLFYDGIQPVPLGVIEERTYYLDKVINKGGFVFSVDYVDDGTGYKGANIERINDYISKARNNGYIPYVARSDRMLDEINIIQGIQPPNAVNFLSALICQQDFILEVPCEKQEIN